MLSPNHYRALKHPLEGRKCPEGEREEANSSVLQGIQTWLLPWCLESSRKQSRSWNFWLVTTASFIHEDSSEEKPAHKLSQLRAAHCLCNCNFFVAFRQHRPLLTAGYQFFLRLSPQRTISVYSPRATNTESSPDLLCHLWKTLQHSLFSRPFTAKTGTEKEHGKIKRRNNFQGMLFCKSALKWKVTQNHKTQITPRTPVAQQNSSLDSLAV